jgi:flavin-dependent dehydrogenase
MLDSLPDGPPIRASRIVQPPQGKLDMTNVANTPTAPGLALVGDAALAIDPLWGVGCGWALQSAGWLADSVAPALRGSEALPAGLKRYRRAHARALRGHSMMIYDYAGGRKFSAPERLLFSTATYDERTSAVMEAFGTRNMGPLQMLMRGVPLAARARARRAISRSGRARSGATPVSTAAPDSSTRAVR